MLPDNAWERTVCILAGRPPSSHVEYVDVAA